MMPPVILAAVEIAADFFFDAAIFAGIPLSIGGAVALGAIAVAGVTAGGIFALSRGLKKPQANNDYNAPTPDDVQQTVRQAIPPRLRHYGKVKVGGAVMFERARDNILWAWIAHAQGQIAGVDEIWLSDRQVAYDANQARVTDSQYIYQGVPIVQLYQGNGADDQVAPFILRAVFPESITSDHRLRGVAWSAIGFEQTHTQADFPTVYPSGVPSLRVVMRASLVYDPRTGLTGYSTNAALCILDHVTHADGMRRQRSEFNMASFAQAANDCDDAIALKAGGTTPRYEISGSYDLSEDPAAVLQRMFDACDGEFYLCSDGTLGLRVGKWTAASETITSDEILSYSGLQRGSDALAAFNQVKAFYQSPDLDFQEIEADTWQDDSIILSTGAEKAAEIHLGMVTASTPSQARRLAKIMLAKNNPKWTGTIVTKFSGLRLLDQRFFTLQIAELGINETFRIKRIGVSPDLTTCTVECYAFASSVYDFNAATEEGATPTVPPIATARPAAPTGLSFGFTNAGTQAGNVKLTGSWSAPAEQVGHQFEYQRLAERAPDGTETWETLLNDFAVYSAASFLSSEVAEGEYKIHIRATNSYGASGYTDFDHVVAWKTTTAPAAVTVFSVLPGNPFAFDVGLPASAGYYKSEFKVDGVSLGFAYGAAGQRRTYQFPLPLGVGLSAGRHTYSIISSNLHGDSVTTGGTYDIAVQN